MDRFLGKVCTARYKNCRPGNYVQRVSLLTYKACFYQSFDPLLLTSSMAQSSTFHASGLERDCRQDEFPTRQDEFPTRQDEFPTAYNYNGQTLPYGESSLISEINSSLPLHKPAIKTRNRVCGLRKSTFWLVATVVVLLVFVGVGAGVLGSRISSSEQKRCVKYYLATLNKKKPIVRCTSGWLGNA